MSLKEYKKKRDFSKTSEPKGEKSVLEEIKKGSVKIVMHGKKLKGEFALVRMNSDKDENNWLLIKHNDDHAAKEEYNAENETSPSSNVTKEVEKKQTAKKQVIEKQTDKKQTDKKQKMNSFSKPMLASSASEPFDGDEWIFEIKWDGYRAIAEVGEQLRFYSRNGLSFKGKYPLIESALNKQKYNMILDGEIVAYNNKEIEYIVCNDKDTLGYLINLGCIELNPWNNRIKFPDKPDFMIMDLDPSEKNSFEQVVETAKATKEVLDMAGLTSYCKTSGSTGLHIYVPMGAKYDYDQVRDFGLLVAQLVQSRLPKIKTLERSLSKRGPKIYLDYLQNRTGQTVASVYSVRPKPGASVSMPVEWDEVTKDLSIQDFTIRNALDRIDKKGDIFSPASSLLITTTQPSGWFSSPRRIQATMLLWSK
jgi:bifunctional non-homologous end joining protein LigD